MKIARGTTLLGQGSPYCLGDKLGGCSKSIVDGGAANDTAAVRLKHCDKVCNRAPCTCAATDGHSLTEHITSHKYRHAPSSSDNAVLKRTQLTPSGAIHGD